MNGKRRGFRARLLTAVAQFLHRSARYLEQAAELPADTDTLVENSGPPAHWVALMETRAPGFLARIRARSGFSSVARRPAPLTAASIAGPAREEWAAAEKRPVDQPAGVDRTSPAPRRRPAKQPVMNADSMARVRLEPVSGNASTVVPPSVLVTTGRLWAEPEPAEHDPRVTLKPEPAPGNRDVAATGSGDAGNPDKPAVIHRQNAEGPVRPVSRPHRGETRIEMRHSAVNAGAAKAKSGSKNFRPRAIGHPAEKVEKPANQGRPAEPVSTHNRLAERWQHDTVASAAGDRSESWPELPPPRSDPVPDPRWPALPPDAWDALSEMTAAASALPTRCRGGE